MRCFSGRLKRTDVYQVLIYAIIGIISLLALLPIVLVISGSITDESVLTGQGFSILPAKLSFHAFRALFANSNRILRSYGISVFVTTVGTFLSLIITAMMAYALSRKDLKLGRPILLYAVFTLLFNGGMVSWYIVVAGMLHLKNSVWALIFPYSVYAWNVFLLKNFMSTIGPEMHESASLDGAGEWRIFITIILPLSKAGLATIALFTCIAYWNDWWLAIMLIDNYKNFPLQLVLRLIMSTIEFLTSGKVSGGVASEIARSIPREGVKMAAAIITIGPLVFVFPFVQRYFVKGITLGSVKG
jgi:putative aldouronate transport system permease protein